MRNQRGQLQFELGRHTEARAAPRLLGNRCANRRIRMSQDHRAPGAHVIEQLIPVRVIEVLSAATLDNQRLAAYGLERPHGTVHAADQYLLGAFENLTRTLALAF